MKSLKPLVTDDPQGNYQWLHNMTVIKNKEVYLRDFESKGDLNLIDYCKKECLEQCNVVIDAPVEEFGEHMDCSCPVSLVYHMAVGHAELREHLKSFESTSPELIEALNEIMTHVEHMSLTPHVLKVISIYEKVTFKAQAGGSDA